MDGGSLRAWQMNIARRDVAEETAKSIVKGDYCSARAGRASIRHGIGRAGYEPLRPRGRQCPVEFGDDASVATLRRVLEALRSC